MGCQTQIRIGATLSQSFHHQKREKNSLQPAVQKCCRVWFPEDHPVNQKGGGSRGCQVLGFSPGHREPQGMCVWVGWERRAAKYGEGKQASECVNYSMFLLLVMSVCVGAVYL